MIRWWTLAFVWIGFTAGCGSKTTSDCSDSLALGTWADTQETVRFTAACGFSNTLCSATATVPEITAAAGTFKFSNYAVGDSACSVPAESERTCTYTISGTTLQLKCGSGTQHGFTKQ